MWIVKKTVRQRLLKQLILEHEIETQEELIRLLEEAGVKATQATISRDIRELSVIKEYQEDGRVKYALFLQEDSYSTQKKLENSLKSDLIRIECVDFVLILHTDANGADVITNYLDEVNYKEIAGTIAGIDTIIIICHNTEESLLIKKRLEELASF